MFKFKNQKGSFFLELMIGLLLSSITVLSVMFVFVNFEKPKRSAIQLGKTISNASLALYPIQEEIKQAGYGTRRPLGEATCWNIFTFDSQRTPQHMMLPVTERPIEITPANNNQRSDILTVLYAPGTVSSRSKIPVKVTESNPGNVNAWTVEDTDSFREGDGVMIYDSASNTCILHEITAVTSPTNVLTSPALSTKNPPTGFGKNVTKDTSAMLKLNVDELPRRISFYITNNQLRQRDFIHGTGEERIIADNIVAFKASIGLDTDEDGRVDLWKNSLVHKDYPNIRGVKIAVLARSPNRELPDPTTGECVVTTNNIFRWDNGNGNGQIDVSGVSDWKCYRYRLLETTVPLKNMIWSPPEK